MLAFIDLETRIPQDHPLRTIRRFADEALACLSPTFDEMYARDGRPSIPPERVLAASRLGLLSDEHFTVDGTLIEAAASLKSFRPKDQPASDEPPDDPGNPTVNFHGQKRSNATHQSTTDPDARLFRKGKGKEAK